MINPDRIKRWRAFIECIFDSLFDPQVERNYRWVTWLWMAGLFLFGVYFWGKFLNWGRIPFDFHDWAEVNAARIEFVRNALRSGQVPLHMSEIGHLRNLTDRYMSIPDAILAPQMILLLFFQTGPFVYINTVILYAVGLLGLLKIRQKYSLSIAATTWMVVIFSFNGYITEHLAVGHVTWWGYFLLPWFFYLILSALDAEPGWRWITSMAFLLFLIFLQGSFHEYTWLLLFLALFGLTSMKMFWLAIKTGAAAVLLSMVRILPPILLLGQFDDQFLGGYASVVDLLRAMTVMKPVNQALPTPSIPGSLPLGWWEYSLFAGIIATAFLLYFGVVRWLQDRDAFPAQQVLILPAAVFLLFSFGDIFKFLQWIPIPLLTGERVSTRLIILPFILVLIMAVLYFDRSLKAGRISVPFRAATFVMLLLAVNELWQHALAWRVTTAVQAFPNTPVDLAIKVVGNHPDAPYIWMIAIGALITAATGAGLLYLSRGERLKIQAKSAG